jgi:hypothetical protein
VEIVMDAGKNVNYQGFTSLIIFINGFVKNVSLNDYMNLKNYR